MARPAPGQDLFARHLMMVAALVLLLLLLWYSADILLLGFAGILAAVFLNGLAQQIRCHLPMPYRVAFVLTTFTLVGLLVGVGLLLAPIIAEQTVELHTQLPTLINSLRQQIQQIELVNLLNGWMQRDSTSEVANLVLGKVPGAVTATFGLVGGLFIVLFLALYLAYSPTPYREGFLHLLPPHRRPRFRELLDALRTALWRWMLGRLAGMLAVGLMTTFGLVLLDVPLAAALGLIAGILDFVPIIGPLLAAVPALLVGMTLSPAKVAYILLLYWLVQQIEGYVLEPYIEKRAIYLPPAITVIAQLLGYLLFGLLGLLLAMPLTAVTMVSINMLYVNDYLGDPVELKSQENPAIPADLNG